jgi:hypothetical protein
MPPSLPTLRELPTVHAAFVWLLGDDHNGADRDVLASARLHGLIQSDAPHWKADGDIATKLTESAIARLPDDPEQLGDILHGLGEIAAHSHAPTLLTLLMKHLEPRRGQLRLDEVLDVAVKRDSAISHPVRTDQIAFAQWLSRARLEWSTFDAAVNHVERPHHLVGGGRFGLRFVARIILSIEPGIIDRWIAVHPDHPSIAAIGSAALLMVFPFDDHAMVAPVFESRNIAIKCFAAASIVCPVGLQSPLGTRDCHKALVAAGFAVADATWMIGMRIKNTVHARYRLEHGREQDSARLRYLEQNPDKALGGLRNAEGEIRITRSQLDRAEEAYSKLLPELEAMLSDMAADWPADGLSEGQMASLEHIFVDTAEIRHRLAAKLSHQGNRDWLLKRNITRLQDFIGLRKNPADIPKEYFLPDEKRFEPIEKWTAQSLVLLYEGDNRGVGWRTSVLVSGVAKAAEKLIGLPFVSGRQPETWQSVMTRSACATRFALAVVASVPEEQKNTVAKLRELAIAHAFALLAAHNLPESAAACLHELTAQGVEHMGLSSTPDEFREKWGLAENLPDFARALALWSSPTLIEKHKQLASILFLRVGSLPLSHSSYNLQMSRMLTLLDMAIASGTQAGKPDLISYVVLLWKLAYRGWPPISNRWEGIADKLAAAVAGDGPERIEIVAEKAFANSYCRRLFDRFQSSSEPHGKDSHAESTIQALQ